MVNQGNSHDLTPRELVEAMKEESLNSCDPKLLDLVTKGLAEISSEMGFIMTRNFIEGAIIGSKLLYSFYEVGRRKGETELQVMEKLTVGLFAILAKKERDVAVINQQEI